MPNFLGEEQINRHIENKSFVISSLKEISHIKTSISHKEKENLYQGMVLTRAVDNALKHLFLSGEITYLKKGFQGKGFRSLGQEAIYGATLKLKTGSAFFENNQYTGDVAGPLIRDLGVFLAMSNNDIETAINAQAGKSGLPCNGRDLHFGNFQKGLLIPAAPLAIATCTLIGIALSFQKKQEQRIAISFIGEGGTSLGEWHEAINFASIYRLPMIFCIENNQTALSTPISLQTRALTFADKAMGYGINSLVVNGNDIEEIACAFKFAADEARIGNGPVLIELITMRMCGHAHHDDMLYLGKDPTLDFDIKPLEGGGYVNANLFNHYLALDPIKLYETKLIAQGMLSETKIDNIKKESISLVKDAILKVKKRPWPQFNMGDEALVFKKPWIFSRKIANSSMSFSPLGITYIHAIALGIKQALLKHKNCYLIGEDIAPPYGNAFMMFKDIMHEFPDRFINTPISENAIVGACVGMALSGLIPIGEIQFNDFVACAMDQVANNAAKTFFRLEQNVPMVLRMPYGGLRRAGPFHSQDTSPWFYRTPGLKIMAPSTPIDAMLMLIKAVDDPDPVLFYEHIALYRDPKIKQQLSLLTEVKIDNAALVNEGDKLSIISYGAYVHVAKNVAKHLHSRYDIETDVIDLRYLMPVDFDTIYESIKKTSRALLIGEDAKTGGILESVASSIGQNMFSYLDAPVTVLGSKNTPVPYAPSLEDEYLLNEQQIIDEALKLIAY